MKRSLHLISAVCLTASALLAAPRRDLVATPGASTGFEFGGRPPTSVFDPASVLKQETATAVGKELDSIRANDGVDVLVVILKDLKGAPPEHVAKRFADAWCSPLFHCVVLHSPGEPASPWIIPGGKLVKRFAAEPVKRQIADACRRAALEPSDDRKVTAAATEASEMLRIWLGDNAYWAYQYQQALQEAHQTMALQERNRKLLLPAAAVGSVLLLACAAVVHQWYRRRRPLEFPQPRCQRRLGAPYAGGNDSSLRLSHGSSSSPAAPLS